MGTDQQNGMMTDYDLADAGSVGKGSDNSRAVALTANGSGAANGGKMRKSGSGFLKGLLRNKSSGSLADEADHREASGPGSEAGSAYAADNAADNIAPEKKKGMKKLLSIGRSKKKHGSSASLSEHGAELEAGADVETYEDQQSHRSGGLMGRIQRHRATKEQEYEIEAEEAGQGYPDVSYNQGRDQRRDSEPDEGTAVYNLGGEDVEEVGPATTSQHAGEVGGISAHHIAGASTYEGTEDGYDEESLQHQQRLQGAEEIEQQQEDEQEEEEDKKEEGGKGLFGLLGRARSGGFSGILGKPKDEATLQAEREAAEAAAAAEEAAAAAAAEAAKRAEPEKEPPIRKFPRGFMWGTATSAYQIEGAYQDEGKGMSIWDAFSHTPGKISGNATGDISTCHFYRFKEDVALMKSMGVKYYRMSFAWSRLFPNGKGKVNERGVAFYNRLINELIANRIMPVVTLYHWDLPLSLQIEEDGWLNPKIVDHFVKYAKLCFTRFGDRVKYWITINEPWCAAVLGHDSGGQHAPGRTVDPAREVYKVAHHMLIAHARTYQMYQRAFKRKQRGKIGLALNGDWYEAKPAADLGEQRRNEKAAERALEFTVGWFARPVYQGDYPSLMRERCGNRLPRFTADQRNMLVGSADFFGLNHYSSHLCEQPAWYKELCPNQDDDERENKLQKLGAQLERMMTVVTGQRAASESEIQEGDVPPEGQPDPTKVQLVEDDDEIPEDPYIESTGYWQDISVDQSDDDVWKTTDMGWGVHPEGIRKMLNYIQKEYNPRGGIVITENGCAVAEDDVDEALKDIERAVYLKRYLTEVHKAILHDDVDVRGYFVWSLLDNFEWGYGYTKKFGLHYVDMQTLERIPKMSANWYAEVVKKNRLDMM